MIDAEFDLYLRDNPPNIRREGTGRADFPIARLNGLCAVEDCEDMGVMRRQSRCGAFVHYCAFHEIVASTLFETAERTAA